MKKVFLSLAALAFVATGTVSCSSDDGGSTGGNDDVVNDDNPGGDDTPGVEGSSFVYNGTQYVLDNNVFFVQGSEEGVELNQYSYEDGGESYVVSEWYLQAYSAFNEGSQPENLLVIYFDVEALDNGDGTYTVQLPNEAENIFPYQVATVVNGEVLTNSNYAYGSIDLNFNSFVLGEETLSVNYEGQDSSISFGYEGNSGLSVENWTSASSVSSYGNSSNSVNLRKAHTNQEVVSSLSRIK